MHLNNLTITLLLPLLLISFLACADKPTEPELTEEDVARIVAEELAKMEEAKADVLSPQEIAEIALRSTVVLRIKRGNGKSTEEGSGFVIGEGQIATVYHAIKDIDDGSTARLVKSTTTHAIESIIAVDKGYDLAIISVPTLHALSLPLGDSDTVKIGEPIYVTSNPEGYIGTFSTGIISAIRPKDEPSAIIQMTASVSEGSSGSPVLNSKGKVIAIATSVDFAGQHLNFASPVNALKTLLTTIQ